MRFALFVLALTLFGFAVCENLNEYVSTAKEVQDLLSEGSDNCYLLMFVWRGEKETEEKEALEAQEIFDEYPECYTANFDVARPDTKALLKSLKFSDDRDNFGKDREITRDDTPLLLAIVNGQGWVASGPKPHKAMVKEIDELYREHI